MRASASDSAIPAWAQDLPPEELTDLAIIARQENIELAEAVRLYGWEQSFSEALARLAVSYSDTFSSSAMSNEGEPAPTVRFTGPVPREAQAYFVDVPIDVNLIGGDGIPQSTLRTAIERVHYAVQGRLNAQVSVSTSGDPQTGGINVEIVGPRDTIKKAEDEAVDALKTVDLPGGISVSVAASEGKLPADELIRGGAILNWSLGDYSDLACTSGWPVRQNTTQREGLITAAHCGSGFYYSGRNVLTYRSKIPANHGDMEFMSSSEDVGHTFYTAVGEYRDIDAPYGTAAQDQYLCFFGRTTGNHCDNVRDTYVCKDEYCNLVSMDDHDTDSGDSGGPWYYGQHAYGVHKGSHSSGLQLRAIWTPIYNTLGDLSLSIKVGAQ